MNSEKFNPNSKRESIKQEPEIIIESDFEDFVPEDFKNNPIEYFKNEGQNIKSGEIERDKQGKIKEDPTAVKELPIWKDKEGKELSVIGKRVNIKKGEIGKSNDPFYEYNVMKRVNELGLPAAAPIAKIEKDNQHLIIMEKVPGLNWFNGLMRLKEEGYNDRDIDNLKDQAKVIMKNLKNKFEEAGIYRKWKLKDMVFDVDIKNKKVNKVIPTDWERTKIK